MQWGTHVPFLLAFRYLSLAMTRLGGAAALTEIAVALVKSRVAVLICDDSIGIRCVSSCFKATWTGESHSGSHETSAQKKINDEYLYDNSM